MTRTPDAHFLTEARYRGAKVVVMSPDYSMASKFADAWLPVEQGHDGAFWMAVNHVILNEFYADRQVPFFEEYARKYTDLPFLVKLTEKDGALRPGRVPAGRRTGAERRDRARRLDPLRRRTGTGTSGSPTAASAPAGASRRGTGTWT